MSIELDEFYVYKTGTNIIKAKFDTREQAKEYQAIMGGEVKCGCVYCERCSCNHQSDEHLCGDGSCFLCDCQHFISPLMEKDYDS